MGANNITLKADPNRPSLESRVAKELEAGVIPDSINLVRNKAPKVLLIVPQYTRIERPLELIINNLAHIGKLDNYKAPLAKLNAAGVTHLKEMKRVGVPMGLLRVGTALKKANYKVEIIDAAVDGFENEQTVCTTQESNTLISYGLTKAEVAKRINSFNPDIVGVTCSYTHQWGNTRATADLVKQIDPTIPIILGGPHVSALPTDALLDSPADFVTIGESDQTIVELVDKLAGRTLKPLEKIKGIAYRKDSKVKQTKPRPFTPNLDSIAIPDWSLVNLKLYSGQFHSAGERNTQTGNLAYGFTSIGCNTKCSFCTIPQVQGPWRSMKQQLLTQYLQNLKHHNITELLLEDDHLLYDPKQALEVFKQLKQSGISWFEEGGLGTFALNALLPTVNNKEVLESIDPKKKRVFKRILEAKASGITTKQLIKTMAESGCYGAYLAVESANLDPLTRSGKPTINANPAYTQQVVRLLSQNGIKTTCGFMIGFIHKNGDWHVESIKDIKQNIPFAKQLRAAGAAYINPFIVTPLPGTKDFEVVTRYSSKVNTDDGFSHEFATIDAPNNTWTKDELNLCREQILVETNGMQKYLQQKHTGTWPT